MAEDPLATLSRIDPGLSDHLRATDRLVFEEGAIPVKYKVLIAMAFDAAHGAGEGVKSLAGRALKAGATKDEIAEAIRVAYHLSGVGSAYTASQALKEVL